MRQTRDLRKLLRMAQGRLRRLRTLADESASLSASEQDHQLAYVVIETANLWSSFTRSYVLSCATNARRVCRKRVKIGNAAVATPADVLLIAARQARGPAAPAPIERRDEPAWHDPSLLLRTCREMACDHLPSIEAALSVRTSVFQHLPVLRNFYAHRNGESSKKALNVGLAYVVANKRTPTHMLLAPAKRRSQALILDWIDEIGVVMDLLCA